MPTQVTAAATAPGILLQNFKTYLKIGIPYYSPQTLNWEPALKWTEQADLPLLALQQALQLLLQTLKPGEHSSPITDPPSLSKLDYGTLSCAANGLELETFTQAINHLTGVIVGYPINWSDTYSFNIREAVLAAELVSQPDQIFLIEDTIGTLLSGLKANRPTPEPEGRTLTTGWRGKTLILNIGAIASEFAIVDIPNNPQELTYKAFTLRSLAYAGNYIDQDIICRLLYPLILKRKFGKAVNTPPPPSAPPLTAESGLFKPTGEINQLWQGFTLEDLTIPGPGDPDPEARIRLNQRLQTSQIGRELLEVAKQIKLALQNQERFIWEVGRERWTITRQQFESQVLLPFMQKLNRELNIVLSQARIDAQAIKQVICTGGTSSFSVITRWLRQKLPQAILIQDSYPEHPLTPSACSRVAYGLASLPLYPQVLDLPRQQYGDYFLLLELLRTFPEQPMTLGSILQRLERRGINTQVCQSHILALLEGHLPPGIVPTDRTLQLFSETSQQNPEYQVLKMEPLFYKAENGLYRPNTVQSNRLQRHLSRVMASTHQKLEEPFVITLQSIPQ